MNNSEIINNMLFDTNAVRVAPADTPFWYTSGKLGPFYINTHFLVKNEQTAGDVLKSIEKYISEDKSTAPENIFDILADLYNSSETYKKTIDILTDAASKYDCDIISGGERRDFFFSMLPAHFLDKDHLTIYKDLGTMYTDCNMQIKEAPKSGKVLHIADLITEASSYERAWIPVIRKLGYTITDTIAVVDRKQNGRKVLTDLGVNMETLTAIDKELFDHAKANNYIDDAQYSLVMRFLEDPDAYMKEFLAAHPTFIDEQIALGGKARERAELAISKGFV